MLQRKSVKEELLELLDKIMDEEIFQPFVLVGGTALALQIGHRKSIDIDLFGQCTIDEAHFLEKLSRFGNTVTLKKTQNILVCSVNGIKVDFVNYSYPFIEEVQILNDLRIASPKDIAAMKLNAIAGRGSKKDFIDIYYLLKMFTIEEMIEFYLKKYQDGSEFMVRKSLTYFEDADKESTPYMFDEIDWNDMKQQILKSM